ncbi:hypothetical protein HYS72_02880 [Candidatus Pacearchaeota archaeon]|nr:hypothetical protein [Candidatus Pacearchaeota archaeon]MBI2056740.1 hypothetical protein [Candidatus Pacearchaeota archaeon]
MTNYKTLIEKIKKGRNPSDHSLKLALREIYLEKDADSAMELVTSLSGYYVGHYGGYEGYSDAYSCVRIELDFLAEKSDDLFGENGIQKFYRKSVNFCEGYIDFFKN